LGPGGEDGDENLQKVLRLDAKKFPKQFSFETSLVEAIVQQTLKTQRLKIMMSNVPNFFLYLCPTLGSLYFKTFSGCNFRIS
jgi:hypothetical protein